MQLPLPLSSHCSGCGPRHGRVSVRLSRVRFHATLSVLPRYAMPSWICPWFTPSSYYSLSMTQVDTGSKTGCRVLSESSLYSNCQCTVSL
jgi:hypothetical protein